MSLIHGFLFSFGVFFPGRWVLVLIVLRPSNEYKDLLSLLSRVFCRVSCFFAIDLVLLLVFTG